MKQWLAFMVVVLGLFAQSETKKKAIIVTMEIPPFMSPHMPDQGAAISGVRQIFKKAGYELEVHFVPVPRMRIVELADKDVNGFFPSFVDEKFEQRMVLSKLFYRTPWVIVERKEKPIVWKEAKDLLKYKGGNVAGYMLRSQVAEAYKNNMQQLETAANDSDNVLKLIHKRVDFIFIDENAFKYITATNPDIKPFADKLKVNSKVVAVNRYGVAFKADINSQKVMEDFNRVADEKEFTAIVNKYIKDRSRDTK